MAMDVIVDNCCHAHVIPDNHVAINRESASKLKVNLHRCTGRSGALEGFRWEAWQKCGDG
jgi:hypothetical protein